MINILQKTLHTGKLLVYIRDVGIKYVINQDMIFTVSYKISFT